MAKKTKMTKTEAALILACKKVATDARVNTAKDTLGVGEHTGTVDGTFEFDLKLGAEYTATVAQKAKPFRLLAAALDLLVETLPKGHTHKALIQKIVQRAEETEEVAEELVKKLTNAAMLAQYGTTETTCKGPLTGSAKVAFAGRATGVIE